MIMNTGKLTQTYSLALRGGRQACQQIPSWVIITTHVSVLHPLGRVLSNLFVPRVMGRLTQGRADQKRKPDSLQDRFQLRRSSPKTHLTNSSLSHRHQVMFLSPGKSSLEAHLCMRANKNKLSLLSKIQRTQYVLLTYLSQIYQLQTDLTTNCASSTDHMGSKYNSTCYISLIVEIQSKSASI